MAKTSTDKRKPSPASIPVKASKTRLNRRAKDKLLDYMVTQFDSRIDDTELNATLGEVLSRINAMLRAKYPEEDMVVLRKYKVTHLDKCIRFTFPDTSRVFAVRFDNPNHVEGRLADIPCLHGCYSNDIFPCDKDFEALADKWEKLTSARGQLVSDKRREYSGFLEACRYLEDVGAVVPLSEEIRKAIGAERRSLTIVSPEVLDRIKSDFLQRVAA